MKAKQEHYNSTSEMGALTACEDIQRDNGKVPRDLS